MSYALHISAKDLCKEVEREALAKSEATLQIPANEVRIYLESDTNTAVNSLARRIMTVDFPYPTFDAQNVGYMVQQLSWFGAVERNQVVEMIPSSDEDYGRSHIVLPNGRWGANHNYEPYWKLVRFEEPWWAAIEPRRGEFHPGRLIDHCTKERFFSSTLKHNYVSPVQGWTKFLPNICEKLLKNIRFEMKNKKEQGLPFEYKPLTKSDFLEACLDVFPCSYHFSPTVVGEVFQIVNRLAPHIFREGCRLLDPSAGHGHRLAGALACPSIKYMGATDPNTRMQEGYQAIFDVVTAKLPANQRASFNSAAEERQFWIYPQKAEDPENPVYKVDKPYNLVLSSPPFFDTEAYGDGSDQSITSFKTFEAWVNGFLEPMVRNCWNALVDEGFLAFNLEDANTHKTVEALMNIITTKLHGEYLGMIPSKKALGAARWIKKEDRTIKIDSGIDPIWLFKKSRLTPS